MIKNPVLDLAPRVTSGGRVHHTGSHSWRLEILPDAGVGDERRSRRYHLAQLDDYQGLPRHRFPWRQPVNLSLRARASHAQIPGTWGFGFWNDPFGMAFVRGGGFRPPAWPNVAWFFFASPENYLSLQDDLPANGALAATFSSSLAVPLAAIWLSPFLPFIFLRPIARWIRRRARSFIRQDCVQIDMETTQWHLYRIKWQEDYVTFSLDGGILLETQVVPHGQLGLVLWIDNQFAAFTPEGRIRFGVLPVRELEWIEIKDLSIE